MRYWNKRWAKYVALSVVIVAGAAAMSEAHHYFRFWWFRPPAPAIEDVTFDDGTIRFASLRSISITPGVGVTRNVRAGLTPDNDPHFAAAVEDGWLTIAGGLDDTVDPPVIDPALPILLSGTSSAATGPNTTTDTTSNVELTIDSTQLRTYFFNSTFRAPGTAVITGEVVETDSTDPANPVVTTTPFSTVLPVVVYGSVHQRTSTGVYHLRGSIRGFQREQVGGDVNYTFLSAYFNAETTVVPAP